jgi:uncharacterized cupredoxin-like copper-binding protein
MNENSKNSQREKKKIEAKLPTNQMLKDKSRKINIKKDKKKSTRVNMLNLQPNHETEITTYKINRIKKYRSTLRQTK